MVKDSSCNGGPAPFLVAVNVSSQVHLIIGSDSLAASRCTKCLESGSKPIVIAPESANMHYILAEYIEKGSVLWLRRNFQDDDLKTLGRDEVDGVVDVVFITVGAGDPLSKLPSPSCSVCCRSFNPSSRRTHIQALPAIEDTGERLRCPRILLFYAACDAFGWSSSYRDHNFGPRLQAGVPIKKRNRGLAPC
jgi:Putative NAD(P)-binding